MTTENNSSKTYQKHEYKEDTFYLGLTMAGAVSAGAYTGGVLDYLFEVLDKWEKAKSGELLIEGFAKADIPKHKVSIDVMGGTSAGGMTTIMTALYAIQGKINPVTEAEVNKVGGRKDNLFYDAWVNLDDEADNLTFYKALTVNDIKDTGKIMSLLNSQFIENIAKTAFSIEGAPGSNPLLNLPSYVSNDLEMLISHTMLKGIPLAVDFSHSGSSLTNPPSHSTYEHFMFSHFRLNGGNPVNPEHYIWLNPFEDKPKEHLKKAAIATGAFPVGLRYREFDKLDFNPDYIKNVLSRIIDKNLGEPEPPIKSKIKWDEESLKDYKSVTVDGGAINNEPYGEVLSILRNRYGKKNPTEVDHAIMELDGKPYQKYGMVMIDPFPDFYFLKGAGSYPTDLLGVAPGIIGTLWDQAKIKRNEMKQQFENKAYRGVIFPVKYTADGKERYINPLACSAINAFSGFLDIEFRHHDFFLGRNNARNFIRAYLSVPYEPGNGVIHPIHRDGFWTEGMREKFKITLKGKDGKDKTFLPIIPDMDILIKNSDELIKERYNYDIPKIPQIPEEKIDRLKDRIYHRSSAILSALLERLQKKGEKNNGSLKQWIGKILKPFKKLGYNLLKAFAAKKARKQSIIWLKEELKDAGLLEGSEQRTEIIKENEETN